MRFVLPVVLLLISSALCRAQKDAPETVQQTPARMGDTPRAPVRVSAGVMAGMRLTSPMPHIPPITADDHVSGGVVLHALIGEDGLIRSLTVISGPEVLRLPVIAAVRQWTYKPLRVNGVPTAVDTTIIVNFQMPASPPSSSHDAPSKPPVRVSAGVIQAQRLTFVRPVFPQAAKDAHVNGAVVMHVLIGEDGLVKSVTPISGPEMLRDAYSDAVRQWTYKPYLLNGVPTAVDTTITMTINFGG